MNPMAIDPRGICQRMVPDVRSTALSVPQGGALQGMPKIEVSSVRSAA